MLKIMAFIESCIDLASLQNCKKVLKQKLAMGMFIKEHLQSAVLRGHKFDTNKHTSSLIKCMFFIKANHVSPFIHSAFIYFIETWALC